MGVSFVSTMVLESLQDPKNRDFSRCGFLKTVHLGNIRSIVFFLR